MSQSDFVNILISFKMLKQSWESTSQKRLYKRSHLKYLSGESYKSQHSIKIYFNVQGRQVVASYVTTKSKLPPATAKDNFHCSCLLIVVLKNQRLGVLVDRSQCWVRWCSGITPLLNGPEFIGHEFQTHDIEWHIYP